MTIVWHSWILHRAMAYAFHFELNQTVTEHKFNINELNNSRHSDWYRLFGGFLEPLEPL